MDIKIRLIEANRVAISTSPGAVWVKLQNHGIGGYVTSQSHAEMTPENATLLGEALIYAAAWAREQDPVKTA